MAVRGLLFDFDGLIVDTESPSLAAWRWLYEQHGQELALDRWSAAIGTLGGFDALGHLESLVGSPLESSSSRTWVDRHLRRLERVFGWDAIVTADGDERRAKPSPTLYLEALDRLGLGTEEAIAFEDSPNGVRAAKAAGLVCVAVPNPVTAALGLAAADLVLDSLASLPLPALIAQASALPGRYSAYDK